jgi:hypothetical protein
MSSNDPVDNMTEAQLSEQEERFLAYLRKRVARPLKPLPGGCV